MAKTLPTAIERLGFELKLEKIILLGPYVYGDPTPDSDVDLLIVMRTRANVIDRYVAVSKILFPRQLSVDIIVKTSKEIKDEEKKRGNFFLREIKTR